MTSTNIPLPKEVEARLKACRKAALQLRSSDSTKKNAVLRAAADLLKTRKKELLEANLRDLAALPESATPAFRDRLLLTEVRIEAMIESLRQVAALPDPVGEEVESRVLESGVRARRVRSPLGVILMIFESRPNVAIEAFSLAFKSGNVILLRGGKESMGTTGVLYSLLRDALKSASMPEDSFWGITDPDRALVTGLLQASHLIDVVVPRGGDGLIRFVVENSRIPIIKNDRGLCHVYVHEDADLEMAARIVVNAKTQRPGVCNSMETLLVHEKVAPAFLPMVFARMPGVDWYVDSESEKRLALPQAVARVHHAEPVNWDTEYLDLKMNCRVVKSLQEAIAHIDEHGSRHSESIVTASARAAREFQSEVDAAAVYWNASTRFTDGFEMGLGGELGISTQKLHVRGPVGLRELTSVRWIVDGTGQVRK